MSKIVEKLSKGAKAMSDVAYAQQLMREAFPKRDHGNSKAAVWAAYRKLKMKTERRARAIWNGEAKRIDAGEMKALEHAALKQARKEYQEISKRITRYEEGLEALNQGDYGAYLDQDWPRHSGQRP